MKFLIVIILFNICYNNDFKFENVNKGYLPQNSEEEQEQEEENEELAA